MTDGVLIEREAELDLLKRAIESACRGQGATVALSGVSGIGKSALLASAIGLAREANVRVVRARGGEAERTFTYGVARQLFERALADVAPGRRERWLAGAAAFATPVVAPAGRPPSLHGDADAIVLHGLYWLVSNMAAEVPLVVVVDDAHWADAASLDFLAYLARRVFELPTLLLYAARPTEGAALVLPGQPETTTSVVRPRQLSEQGTVELLTRLLDGRVTADLGPAIRAATGGNPFLVHELARALHDELAPPDEGRIDRIAPAGLARSILMQLRPLGPAATDLVMAVALFEAGAELRHAAALAGLPLDEAGKAADALAEVAILTSRRPLQFVYPLVRTTVYAQIPSGRRAAGHLRAARLLTAEGAEDDAIAAHLLAAEPAGDTWVVARLRAAATAALRRGASDAACVYLARARAEPPTVEQRVEVLHELGSAELRAARPTAAETLRTAFDAGSRSVAGELSMALLSDGRASEGASLLEHEAAVAGGAAALRLQARIAGLMQMELATARLIPDRLAPFEGRLSSATEAERLLLAVVAFQRALTLRGTAAEVADAARRALAGGALLREQEPDGQSFYSAVGALVFAGRFAEAAELYGLAVDDARERGSLFGFAIACSSRCLTLARAGSLTAAEADSRAVREALGRHVGSGLLAIVTSLLLPAWVEHAPGEECAALLAETGTDADLPPLTSYNPLLHARARLRLADGDAAGALTDLEELGRRDAIWGMVNPSAWPTRSSTALAHLCLGQREPAQRLAAEELDLARRWGAPGAIACALRACALADGGGGAVETLREAVEQAAASEAQVEHARSLAELGAALRRAGHPRDARGPLREALDLAHRCGALRLETSVHDELVLAGARPRRVALTGPKSLTASEVRVARAAAAGMANRTIARNLFISVRTVEGHLTNAYRKLDIGTRDQLASALEAPEGRWCRAPSARAVRVPADDGGSSA